MEWGTRPSRMTAASTPFSTALVQVSSFGIMPPVIVPSAFSSRIRSTVRSEISSPALSSTPMTSVSRSRREASSAEAMAPATVSALML